MFRTEKEFSSRKSDFCEEQRLLFQKSLALKLSSIASVAQLVERALRKRKVTSSNLVRGTDFLVIIYFGKNRGL